jgi:hypothetical protein
MYLLGKLNEKIKKRRREMGEDEIKGEIKINNEITRWKMYLKKYDKEWLDIDDVLALKSIIDRALQNVLDRSSSELIKKRVIEAMEKQNDRG